MPRRVLGPLLLLGAAAALAQAPDRTEAVALRFRPPEGYERVVRCDLEGTADVSAVGKNLPVFGELVMRERYRAYEPDRGTLTAIEILDGRAGIETGGQSFTASVRTKGQTAEVYLDERGRIAEVVKPLRVDDPEAVDFASVVMYILSGAIYPEEPVDPGDIWAVDHDSYRLDGPPITFAGRSELRGVEVQDGRTIAHTLTKLRFTIGTQFLNLRISGEILDEIESRVDLATGIAVSRTCRARGVLRADSDDPAAVQIEATLRDLRCEMREWEGYRSSDESAPSPDESDRPRQPRPRA